MSDFATLVIDPPWKETGGGRIKRGADRHYPLLSTEQIIRTIWLADEFQPARDAHLYLWATNTFLVDGLDVMRSLGFRYVTNVAWAKQRPGIGQYFRGQHELCLFGVRGSGYACRTEARGIPSLIVADRGRHSAKPEAFYAMVEKRSKGPYLEMFARTKRDGWTSWGNEAAA